MMRIKSGENIRTRHCGGPRLERHTIVKKGCGLGFL
jgi:hypothetical protein